MVFDKGHNFLADCFKDLLKKYYFISHSNKVCISPTQDFLTFDLI
jgi:hypothetical protein